jgi:hypothetical protein
VSNVLELRNGAVKRIIFYEVSDAQNIAIWGGESPSEALKWYRKALLDSKIWVSEWLTDEEDAKRCRLRLRSLLLYYLLSQIVWRGGVNE